MRRIAPCLSTWSFVLCMDQHVYRIKDWYYASFMSIDSKLTGACLSTHSFVLCLIHCSAFIAPHSPAHLWVWWLVGWLTCRAILLTCRAILLPCRAMLLTCRTILLTCLAMPSVAAPWLIAMPCCLIAMPCHALPHWHMSHTPHM